MDVASSATGHDAPQVGAKPQRGLKRHLAAAAAAPIPPDVIPSDLDRIIALGNPVKVDKIEDLIPGIYYNTYTKMPLLYEGGHTLLNFNRRSPIHVDISHLVEIPRKNYGKFNNALIMSRNYGIDSKKFEEVVIPEDPEEHKWGCVPTNDEKCPDYSDEFAKFMNTRKYASRAYNITDETFRYLNTIEPKPKVIGKSNGITRGTEGMWSLLKTDTSGLRNEYQKYSFLRNIIDLLHDFLRVGVKYLPDIYNAFEKTHPGLNDRAYNEWKERIQKIITSGGDVSQTRARDVCLELIEEFNSKLILSGASWIVKTHANALICEASLTNDTEMERFFDTLQKDRVTGIYIESFQGSPAQLYKYAAKYGIQYVSIKSGDWDAGGGFSSAKAEPIYINAKVPFTPITICRTPHGCVLAPNLGNEDTSWSSFGLNQIFLDEITGIMHIINRDGIKFSIMPSRGPQKLSVNSIAKIIGESRIRGNKDNDMNVQDIIIETIGKIDKIDLLILKAWTDTIQTIDSLADPINHKIGVVYSDILAELTGMFESGKCSILQKDNKLQYYCYDSRARNVPDEIINLKLYTRLYITMHIGELITKYIEPWFDTSIRALEYMIANTNRPSIYFAAIRAYHMIIKQKDKDKIHDNYKTLLGINADDSLDESYDTVVNIPTTVSDFLDKMTNSEEITTEFVSRYDILEDISEKIGSGILRISRASPEEVIDLIYNIRQEIININNNIEQSQLYIYVGIIIAYGFTLIYSYKSLEFPNTSVNSERIMIEKMKIHTIASINSLIEVIEKTEKSFDEDDIIMITNILIVIINVFNIYISNEDIKITTLIEKISTIQLVKNKDQLKAAYEMIGRIHDISRAGILNSAPPPVRKVRPSGGAREYRKIKRKTKKRTMRRKTIKK